METQILRQLTMSNKHLSFSEKMEAIESKLQMIDNVGSRCSVCGNSFRSKQEAQLAHIVPKHKNNIEKYGLEAIHHPYNMRITCSKCNSSVMLNVSKKELLKEHFLPIYADLSALGYDVEDATDRLLRGE